MSRASDYLENALLDHITGNTPFAQPANLYISLYTSAPGDDDSGTEVSGNAYARVLHNTWNTAAARGADNNGQIDWAEPTGPWGSVSHFGIHDAISAGNLLFWGQFDSPMSPNVGLAPYIQDGKLDVTVQAGGSTDYLANQWLDHVLKNTPLTVPALWSALFVTPTDDSGGGTEVPSSNGYAREQVSAWDAAASGATANTNAETFGPPTASWGTSTHHALFDASTLGNMLLHGALDSPIPIDENTVPVEFAAGALSLTID